MFGIKARSGEGWTEEIKEIKLLRIRRFSTNVCCLLERIVVNISHKEHNTIYTDFVVTDMCRIIEVINQVNTLYNFEFVYSAFYL